MVLLTLDLSALTQTLLLADEPELARAEPKALRYRLLPGSPAGSQQAHGILRRRGSEQLGDLGGGP